MKLACRSAVGAVLVLSLVGAAQADSVLKQGLLRDLAPITFNLASGVGVVTFTGSVKPNPSLQFAPGLFQLFSGLTIASTPLATSSVSVLPGGSKALTFSGLAAGNYTLQMVSQYTYTPGTYLVTTSLDVGQYSLGAGATPVPEAGALAMALAGVGVLGLLGRRRKV
jgi:hypothetical protein